MRMEFARSGAWVALDNVSAAGLAFLFFVVTARLLTPEQFGLAALALSVVQILQPLIDSLFHDAIVQRQKLTPADVTTASTFCVIWSIFLATGLWAATPLVAAALSAPALSDYLPWMGLSLALSGLSSVAAAEARRNLKFRWLAIRTIIGRLVGMSVGFWLAWRGYGVWAVVAQMLLSAGMSSLLVLVANGGGSFGRIAIDNLRPLLSFAGPTVGTQFLLYANSRIVTLIVGGALGPVSAGIWSVALRFVEPLQAVLATTIGQFFLPFFSRRQSDPAALGNYFTVGTRYLSIGLVPAFLGLAVCSKYVIEVFVGERWLAATPVMQIVCLVTMIALLRQVAEITLTARGRPRFNLYTHLVASVLSIGGACIGVLFGQVAAAAGWATRVVPFVTVNAMFVRRELGIPILRQLAQPIVPLLAGAFMCFALYALDVAMPVGMSPLSALLLMIGSGAAVYFGALYAMDREFRTLIHSVRRRRAPS